MEIECTCQSWAFICFYEEFGNQMQMKSDRRFVFVCVYIRNPFTTCDFRGSPVTEGGSPAFPLNDTSFNTTVVFFYRLLGKLGCTDLIDQQTYLPSKVHQVHSSTFGIRYKQT